MPKSDPNRVAAADLMMVRHITCEAATSASYPNPLFGLAIATQSIMDAEPKPEVSMYNSWPKPQF